MGTDAPVVPAIFDQKRKLPLIFAKYHSFDIHHCKMRVVLVTFVLMAFLASTVAAKDRKNKKNKKAKKPVKVALLMPEDLRNVVTIETSHSLGFKEMDNDPHGHHEKLGHYGHPPDDCEKDEIAVQINGKLMTVSLEFRTQAKKL